MAVVRLEDSDPGADDALVPVHAGSALVYPVGEMASQPQPAATGVIH
jgi:hypothetical protein